MAPTLSIYICGSSLIEHLTLEQQIPAELDLSDILTHYIPEAHARLLSNPPARIADIGCGSGQSSIDMALAYPRVRVDGYDMDDAAIETAWAKARRAGVLDRVTFHVRDIAEDTMNGRYDLIILSMPLHDMEKPVDVLKTVCRLVKLDAIVIILAKQTEIDDLSHFALKAGFNNVDILTDKSTER